ncbi:hypothetical protein L2W58_03495 [Dethiosulfovibrio sp. F2B]|uniref:hypothetical protein n=1 Tax=Dethiosulfovibrio faecalis TaxID=2720018 RepID=UPI001F1B4F61|nr:hypothetical protein [Dethiosulfovibrio faecalis]MCF4150855.1 hypothetical protein [Dethiosulfovibrio faecalis]
MGLLDILLNNMAEEPKSNGMSSLKEAYLGEKAPQDPGVYKVFYKNQLMKVGKAEDGLRKRFSDYYRTKTGGTAGLQFITMANRDDVYVAWSICEKDKCRRIEKELYDKAKREGKELPWSERR